MCLARWIVGQKWINRISRTKGSNMVTSFVHSLMEVVANLLVTLV